MFNPIWGFDFKITITKHIVTMVPGQKIAVPVIITKIRGNPQKLDLDVNTNWESMGLSANVLFDFTIPMPEWTGNLFIKSSSSTPPDSYLFTVRASAQGTFHTSEDAITVVVEPKSKEEKEDAGKQPKEEDQEDFFQPKQAAPAGSASAAEPGQGFNLDKLFASSSPKSAASGGRVLGGKPPSMMGLILGIIGVFVFTFILIWAMQPTRTCVGSFSYECSDCSGNYENTTMNNHAYGSCRATTVRNGDLCTLSCR
ncbi:MAG: hypothetical protein ABSA74_03070 [Candidatus Staskawiczbacteria bacterium]|jgi:hypothetical protein